MRVSLAPIESLVGQKIGMYAKIKGRRKIARAVESRRSLCGSAELDADLKVLTGSPAPDLRLGRRTL